jgi:hypothetical protein
MTLHSGLESQGPLERVIVRGEAESTAFVVLLIVLPPMYLSLHPDDYSLGHTMKGVVSSSRVVGLETCFLGTC